MASRGYLGRQTYYKYFAPRIGLAYRLSEQTVVRGGFGMSYEPFTNNQYAFNFPIRQNEGSNQTNSFALPTINGVPATMANGFPAPIAVAIASDGTVTPNPAENYIVVDKHFQQPYVESYNFAVQQSLPKNFVLEPDYFTRLSSTIKMFPGLMSRWMIPFACAAFNAFAV